MIKWQVDGNDVKRMVSWRKYLHFSIWTLWVKLLTFFWLVIEILEMHFFQTSYPGIHFTGCCKYQLIIRVLLRLVNKRPPLWSSDQSSWPQIQRSGFDSRRHQIFLEVVVLERGPHSLVSTIEELLGRKNSGSGLESQEYGRRDPSLWTCGTLCPQIVGTNFADMRWSLGRYSSFTDSCRGV
jgi:hypothetical protein